MARTLLNVRNIGPSFSVYDPVYGRVLKSNFSAYRYTPEFAMKITTNSEGFRGPITEKKPILFLGDSFTLGYGVNDGEEFPQLVGQALGVQVLNRGIGNSGQAHWLKFLEKEAQRYDPRIVVLQFLGNDYYDNVRQRQYDFINGQLVELKVPKPTVRNTIQSLIESIPGLTYSHLISLTREIRWNPTPVSRTVSPKGISNELLTLAMVRRAIDLCRVNGWPVLLVIIEVTKDQLAGLKRLPVEILVLPNKSEAPEFFYKTDGHWNANGHEMAAERITEHILNNEEFSGALTRQESQVGTDTEN